jgi:hypothetical protein
VRVDGGIWPWDVRDLGVPALSPTLAATQLWVAKSVTYRTRPQRATWTHDSKVLSVAACSRSASPGSL